VITSVMAHASFSSHRRELMPQILESWDGYLDHIIEDDIGQGAWPTVRSCWHKALELAEGKGHVLAAQDDFLLAKGAPELMDGLSDKFPDRIISFRWAQASCSWLWHQCVDQDLAWGKVNHAWTGGAVALPIPVAEEFLEWAERFDDLGGASQIHLDDARLDLFFLGTGRMVWRPRWTLMHHLGDDYSVIRGMPNLSPEMGRVASTAEVPGLDDPRWDRTDVPEYNEWPEAFRLTASTMLRGRQAAMGLR
jgi:hypothetical protein